MKTCKPRLAREVWRERVKGIALCVLAVYVGLLLGDRRWPYSPPVNRIFTPTVTRGDYFTMSRMIDYREDCAIYYERYMLSAPDPTKENAVRRIDLQNKSFDEPLWEIDRKPWYIKEYIPNDFPCGPAKIIDRPRAACGWFQKTFWWQRKPDAVTNFTVTGCEAGHDSAKMPG